METGNRRCRSDRTYRPVSYTHLDVYKRQVDALTKEKTIIMIAHRLKTVRHADQIVVVDKGKIVQQGTHEQLMKQEGIYKRFVDARQQAVSWKLVY